MAGLFCLACVYMYEGVCVFCLISYISVDTPALLGVGRRDQKSMSDERVSARRKTKNSRGRRKRSGMKWTVSLYIAGKKEKKEVLTSCACFLHFFPVCVGTTRRDEETKQQKEKKIISIKERKRERYAHSSSSCVSE